MLLRAITDDPHAILGTSVLRPELRDSGVRFRLMDLTIDQKIVPEIRNHTPCAIRFRGRRLTHMRTDGPHARPGLEALELLISQRPKWVEVHAYDKDVHVIDRHPRSPVQHRIIAVRAGH